MRKNITGLTLILFCFKLFGQQKDFEGIIFYKTTVKSASGLISENVIKNMLGVGNQMTVWIKQGNYRQISDLSDMYYINTDQRLYIKFRNLDTLYFLEYSSDTSSVTMISKSEEKRTIAGYECKLLTVQLGEATRKYYYAPALYMNAEYDKNNTLGRYDVFAKETSSLYLDYEEETKSYNFSQACTRLQQTVVPDSIFKLPRLPQKKFSPDELIIPPEFTRSGGWAKYLQSSIDSEVGSKFLKIPKGEEMATQKVMVRFLVNEYGRVSYAEVENKKEVHPKLAEEALRVVNASPPWRPATIYGGEKAIYWQRVPITFQVSKK
jgi:hypothetical protein